MGQRTCNPHPEGTPHVIIWGPTSPLGSGGNGTQIGGFICVGILVLVVACCLMPLVLLGAQALGLGSKGFGMRGGLRDLSAGHRGTRGITYLTFLNFPGVGVPLSPKYCPKWLE